MLHTRPRPPLPAGPFVVAGLGMAGTAAARALARVAGPENVVVWGGRDLKGERARGADLREAGIRVDIEPEGVGALDAFGTSAAVIKSPGLGFQTPLIAEAQRRGLVVIDEAELAWRLDHRPVVAVTGTNGKSTTASLLLAVLGDAGCSPLLAGNTTFGTAYSAVPAGTGDLVVAELSSFQLEGCPELLPDAAVLTNVTDDHLYRHGSRARYVACKRRAFVRGRAAVPVAAVGIDDLEGRLLADELRGLGSVVVSFGRHPAADRRVLASPATQGGGQVTIAEGGGQRTFSTRLTGLHNALNLAGALALADGLGIDPQRAAAAMASVAGLPGRFERVGGAAGVDVVVDFAHNRDGVVQALAAGRALLLESGGRLRVVLSTLSLVGEHQARQVGGTAAELADHLVLTTQRVAAEEPGDRLPAGLLEGAREALAADSTLEVELDRAAAVSHAILAADPGDLVLILDRGERSGELLRPDGTAAAFDDREQARAALAARAVAPGPRG